MTSIATLTRCGKQELHARSFGQLVLKVTHSERFRVQRILYRTATWVRYRPARCCSQAICGFSIARAHFDERPVT